MITLDEFYENFLQSILVDTESRGLLKSEAFFENVCEELVSIGELSINYTMSDYIKKGMELNGYDYDEERQLLSLIVHYYFQENSVQTLTRQHINTKFKRLKNYLTSCISGLYEGAEETSDGYNALYNIYRYFTGNKISKVKFIIITDGKATRNLVTIPDDKINEVVIEHQVIDIEYIYKIYLSEFNSKTYEVNVKLPYLKVSQNVEEYDSYLVVMDGNSLADIYEQYGQRLFEQNVRTFLQFRGKVNKGLRTTIEFSPKQFFAYNNGITATASDIEVNDNGHITKISDFQIVNGAQTTSAIYAAKKNYKLNIDDVFVQMKLSIIKNNEEKNQAVAKISEYANTQNKVNKSDFFSNSPFHKEFKNYANRIWISAKGGSQRRTHWFYERVRGAYLNEQAYLTKAEKKKFILENPKTQLVDKTFLAKSENTWMQQPNVVSRGAQFSFQYFAEKITDELEKNNLVITESYFKEAISRVILFRKVEKLVSAADWYNGGYRAQIVTYTIAFLAYIIKKQSKFFSFSEIWENQEIPEDLIEVLKILAKIIHEDITNPPEGYANVSQWCKQKKCWDSIKQVNVSVDIPSKYLIEKQEMKYIKKEEKKAKKLDRGIEMQIFVVNEVNSNSWNRIYDFYSRQENIRELSGAQRGILKSMSMGKLTPPSEKQSKILYEIYLKAEEQGILV
ncbi:AIPR family protein [Vallitalea sediminicola]